MSYSFFVHRILHHIISSSLVVSCTFPCFTSFVKSDTISITVDIKILVDLLKFQFSKQVFVTAISQAHREKSHQNYQKVLGILAYDALHPTYNQTQFHLV